MLRGRTLLFLLLVFLLSAACSGACYLAAGASLSLFIGGVLFAAILTPPLAEISRWNFIAVTLGISTMWLTVPGTWFVSMLVLLAFTAAVSWSTRWLIRVRIPPTASAAIVTMLSLAWLTWPIWLSRWLVGRSVHWLVALHPIFAINTAAKDLGIWTEQRVMYRLTNLGQDVPYQLPSSAMPCIFFHAAIAILLYLAPRAQHRGLARIRGAAHAALNK